MPRRSDPVVAVVNYFETAPIEAALVTLAVAKEIVARREGKPAPQVRRRGPGKKKAVEGQEG